MTVQYLRKVSLILGDASGNGIDLSELRIVFRVQSGTTQTPRRATMRVYNVADDTANKLKKEFTHVFLQAGYEGSYGQIFSGGVLQIRKGRENPTDTFIDIVAADNDKGYNFAVVNKTLAAGWSQTDYHKALINSMVPYGVTAGYTPDFASTKMPRGKVCFGMSRDYFRDLSEASGSQWTVQDGYLHMVPIDGVMDGQAVVLTSNTGMVGQPVQTLDGIVIKALLNPNIKTGGQVVIDNASIQTAALSADYTTLNYFPSLDDDGRYKVYSLVHSGDTRGEDFYSEMICVGINDSTPLSGTFKNAVVDGK